MLKSNKHNWNKESVSRNSMQMFQMNKSAKLVKPVRNVSPVNINHKGTVSTSNPIEAKDKSIQLKTLRQQINSRLSLRRKQKRIPSQIGGQKTTNNKQNKSNNECLSSLRKMLTEYSPQSQKCPIKAKKFIEQKLKMKRRQNQRKQFQLRQSQMLKQKQQKLQLALSQKLRNQIMGCTFKPKLTTYHRR